MRINEIYNTYKNDIDFYCIYVKEAHPEDSIGGFKTARNVDAGISFNQPTNIEERAEVAQVCMLRMELELPMLLDDMDDTIEQAYVAWPDRLFLLGTDGRVVYRSEMGPYGFNTNDWEQAMKDLLVSRQDAAE